MYILYIMHFMKYTHFMKKEEHCRIIYSNSLYINLIRICLHVLPQGVYDARVLNVCFPT